MLNTLNDNGPERFTFSFSGLKTAVLRAVQASDDLERDRADLARAFQDAVLAVLVEKAWAAVTDREYPALVIGGGVACNRALAAAATARLGNQDRVVVASNRLNTDNAEMIGAAAAFRLARGEQSGSDLEPRADLPFPGLTSTPVTLGTTT
jgi:N6-L-threonylcarbamoyladenine synthase